MSWQQHNYVAPNSSMLTGALISKNTMQSSQSQQDPERFRQHIHVERLDRPVTNGTGIEYASMNFFRNQVGLKTMELTMLLKEVEKEARRTGKTAGGDLTTLYPVVDVYSIFQRRGIVRIEYARKAYPVLDDPSSSILLNKTKQYAPRVFFKNTFNLSEEVLDQYLNHPKVEHRKAIDATSGEMVIIHPVLNVIKLLTEAGFFRDEEKIEQPKTEEEKQYNLESYLKSLAEGTSVDQETFEKLLLAFGPSRIVDIIYRLRPAFRDIPVGNVEKVIPNYLGDCLVQHGGLRPDAVVEAGKDLSDKDDQLCLYESLKYHCFELFLSKKKTDKQSDESELLRGAIDDFGCELRDAGAFEHELVKDIWQAVEEYYLDLTERFDKPDCLIDCISSNRLFPDMSQRINIKEIRENKRMIIADEMSGGKSASAIIAKEYLKAKLAVICVPGNVVSTWKNYLLSDEKNENGMPKGYFKEGQRPRVLVVESAIQLGLANPDEYDYILISHTRLGMPEYSEIFKKIPYDMFILDESHKLKNISGGVQSQAALQAMNKLTGDNEYVVMLSGTPVPNKVRDVAFLLKALFPERFDQEENSTLIWKIINGGIVGLRNLLIPRMQMKKLNEIVDMSPIVEHPPIHIDISPVERAIYNQVFVEDDQFTPTQKIIGMRQFLMNPEIFEPTPGFPSSMPRALARELLNDLVTHDKILVFTNNYIDGILRKNNHKTTIIEQLGLSADVTIEIIDKDTDIKTRDDIQRRFNSSQGKMIVFASGQTADVGVDFSGADVVMTYNLPWTKHDYLQQIARANRCNRNGELQVKTFLCRGTIEEGIRDYIQLKYRAIERLLQGIPLSEEDRRLLGIDSKTEDDDADNSDILAAYHLEQSGELMGILRDMYLIGEEKFKRELIKRGDKYASRYAELSNRCYQANMNRMSGVVIQNSIQEKGQLPANISVLDMASGPEMLRKYIHEDYQDTITSLDLNEKHFLHAVGKTHVGSFLDTKLESGTYDYINCSLGFHYTPEATSAHTETLQLLREINRLLRIGGRAIITLNYNHELKNPELFRIIISSIFGFDVVDAFTGVAEQNGIFRAQVITLEKREDVSYMTIPSYVGILKRREFQGLQIKKAPHSLIDGRWIMSSVNFNGRAYPVSLNSSDAAMHGIEKNTLRDAKDLFTTYSTLRNMPEDVLSEKNFRSLNLKTGRVLLKQISNGDNPRYILVKPELVRSKKS